MIDWVERFFDVLADKILQVVLSISLSILKEIFSEKQCFVDIQCLFSYGLPGVLVHDMLLK